MTRAPTVSVLMAVYNTERYLAQAVESILGQTFTDFELVIIDDGSTDRSLKILERYAARDDRIRLISRENRGIPKTRNELLKNARGKFIAVMDSDDVAMSDRIARQVEFLSQHPDVLCVGGAYDWIDEAGRVLINRIEPIDNNEIQQRLLQGVTCIHHPTAVMYRLPVLQVNGYDESLPQAEDLDLFLKLGEIGNLANLSETVLQYRQHNRSISKVKQFQVIALLTQVCQRARQRRGIEGQLLEIQPWLPYDRPSRQQYFLRYGWWFFNTRQRWAAIIYGWRAILALPHKLDGWKLLLCALVKPLTKPTSS
jgi:glycosyltransferase involved in cell wall biosynthesis